LLGLLGISRGQRHPVGDLPVQADLECVLAWSGQGNVEHQNGAGFDIHHSGGRLAELHRAFSSEQFVPALIHKPDPNGMDPDLGSAPAHPQHQVSTGIHGRKVGEPDVLEHAQHAELALLVDQGVIGDDSEVEMQLS
jgi:hypothetical protein